ncbi:MAG TPA: hypothetical protein VGQ13_06680 [Nitrososphaera sp.]|jgi:uncharacterized protein (DUF983 family)|nr:hypothetical protein [Nitrososphaera sp.]
MATIFEAEKPEVTNILANEMECPRCYQVMTLCNDFETLFYACEECDFILHTVSNEKA